MIFQKLDTGNVLVTDTNGISRKLSSNLNVLPHPYNDDFIVLTNESRVNVYSSDYRFKWQDISTPTVSDREDAIRKLSTSFFNVDEIVSSSISDPAIIDSNEETGVTYVGYASKGTTSLSEAKYMIKRITESGNITTIEYANGDKNFDKVWNDRESYSYSFNSLSD